MARARNIKPRFFINEEMVELPFFVRLLFIGLWTIADRAGRMEDRPKRIKMDLFPADDVDVDAALDELQASKFLLRYESNGERYIQILTFEKHQNPHKDEKASAIPAPKLHGATIVQPEDNNGSNPAISPIPDSLNPDSPKQNNAADRRNEYPDEFEDAYQLYPSRPGSSKKKAFAAWQARLKAGATPEEIKAGVIRYAAYVAAMRTEPQYIQMPATFFGPSEGFHSNWVIPSQPRGSPAFETAKDKSRREASEQLTGRTGNEQRTIIDLN